LPNRPLTPPSLRKHSGDRELTDAQNSKHAIPPIHHLFIKPSYTVSLEGEQAMAVEISELDELQSNYKAAVDDWIAVIRQEEALASEADHSITEIDKWEHADDREEEARKKAKAAKRTYEDALREKFFHF